MRVRPLHEVEESVEEAVPHRGVRVSLDNRQENLSLIASGVSRAGSSKGCVKGETATKGGAR